MPSASEKSIQRDPAFAPGSPPVAPTSLSRTQRLRLSLIGFAIALLALAICAALGLLIAGGPFHTSLGSLA